jgi:hypothetical protein
VSVCAGFAVAELDACDEAGGEEDEADEDEAGACGEPDADAPPRAVADEVAGERPDDREAWPSGDGVRVPSWLDGCPCVGGVGAEIDGTEEPPPEQAETVTARRTAPAAERPAISHAPGAATGGVRRIFMYPPRMRVR